MRNFANSVLTVFTSSPETNPAAMRRLSAASACFSPAFTIASESASVPRRATSRLMPSICSSMPIVVESAPSAVFQAWCVTKLSEPLRALTPK